MAAERRTDPTGNRPDAEEDAMWKLAPGMRHKHGLSDVTALHGHSHQAVYWGNRERSLPTLDIFFRRSRKRPAANYLTISASR
jgi:hypothetical protein